ncbi:MAG: hypothetical protein J2P49_04245 [Methylocapsa sp.]|nr:hypothetical protein [Methylocapsa sp.]
MPNVPGAPKGHMVHMTPHRLRIRVPAKRHDKRYFLAARQHLAEQPGVRGVEVNPATASILIHSQDSMAFLDALGSGGPFAVIDQPSAPAQASTLEQARQQLGEWNAQLQRWTGSRHDARAYIFIALVLSAAYQLIRGDIFAPAATLLWYSGEALRLWVPQKGSEDANAPADSENAL